MLVSIVKANPAIRGCSRLEPKGRQSSPGRLTWPGVHSENCRCNRADLNPPVSNAEHGNAVAPGHAVRGRPNRKAGKRRQHGEDRRSQRRFVMSRICPRRSGLEWQENMWNRLKLGRANDERCQSLGATQSCCAMEHSAKRPHASIAKLLDEIRMHPQDARFHIT